MKIIVITNTMLTINELSYTLDSLQKNLKQEISYSENNNLRTGCNCSAK
jgi:lipopolysaccharide export system permease protein